jgi:7-cyano-7-deazaguanine synthase in queuosine biosynthesis
MQTAQVVLNGPPVAGADVLRLRPGVNLTTGEAHFRQTFPTLTSLEIDVLTVAASIFACDLAFKRGEREEVIRQISLTIPVVNLPVFNNVREQLRFALYRVSHDAWNITFVQRSGKPEVPRDWYRDELGKVLLFSGGLDSFAAAIQYGDAKERVQLVSHITANKVVSGAQEILYEYLKQQFPAQFSRVAIRVGGVDRASRGYPFPPDQTREETQRTRSLLFLALAALTARRRGFGDVVLIAENGQMSIHLPLTAARISAFSTHTAHPEFVSCMGEILSTLLGYSIRILNPFLYLTKAGAVESVVRRHLGAVKETVSCWKASRVSGRYKHCGFCLPCLVRRIAVEANGADLPEYKRNLFSENVGALPPDDDGKCNLIELGEFVRLFEQQNSQALLQDTYPELINPHIDAVQAIAMYQRFAVEARGVFNRYPQVRTLLR